jgi:SNF2 family DNA or RNA helicase
MKVSAAQPFQIVYSLYQHEYMGFLFESFVVHVDQYGKLTFQHQNISSQNAREFASGLDEKDFKLIELMDSMQQEAMVKKFSRKLIKPAEFFLKIYDKQRGNVDVQNEIESFLEKRRAKILSLIKGRQMYEMGNDGEPTWRKIEITPKNASVLFHFRRNADNTHYFPTIKYNGEKLEWQYKGAYLICHNPAWLVLNNKLYGFQGEVDGYKLKPFLNKKFIVIPRNLEDTYYKKFIAPLVASFKVFAKGFKIENEKLAPEPVLNFSEFGNGNTMDLFEEMEESESDKIMFELSFRYGNYQFPADKIQPISVKLEKQGNDYTFHKVRRVNSEEKSAIGFLSSIGMSLKNARAVMSKPEAFNWINDNLIPLEEKGFKINQKGANGKRYFLGESSIKVQINESIDWFDVNAIVKFGEFEIPFKELRKYITKNRREIKLPNGELAVIPESWFREYGELFAFVHLDVEKGTSHLYKHHLALISDLKKNQLAEVTISRKLEKLKNLESIGNFEMPLHFTGTLRPYQKAGYDWLCFLNEFGFGGCLADDMGLGKTVQTLALLQARKSVADSASLLVMPTSLLYNWEMEIKKFTPRLRIFIYTGTHRKKNPSVFEDFDIILTSYGIIRLDAEILSGYNFDYIILDESQAIKNPSSIVAKAVHQLNSKYKLILTGTPVENSTLDLWSQISFINPGLLGTMSFFKNEYMVPIEKKKDESKTQKLYSLIKPFILRRQKSQVAKELPEKVENIKYSEMTARQAEMYDEVKSKFRNQILDTIEKQGLSQSQLLVLQGLTQLRQLANHPKMVDESFEGVSGKIEDVMYMLDNAQSEGHKTLVFSQFVKLLTIMRSELEQRGYKYCYLDGSTRDRKSVVEQFQNDDSVRIFLISLKAGGLGLNLTEADYVFLLDPWWNPAVEAQAVDRAHRIGQDKKVFTYKFITRNSVEEKILELQKKKLKLAQNLITKDENIYKSFSKEEIESILA